MLSDKSRVFLLVPGLFLSFLFAACGGGGSSSTPPPADGTSPVSKSIVLNWTAPTARTDGSSASPSDIAGYKVHYGTSSGVYSKIINVGNVSSYTLTSMTANTYYIAISAYDNNAVDSALSTEQVVTVK